MDVDYNSFVKFYYKYSVLTIHYRQMLYISHFITLLLPVFGESGWPNKTIILFNVLIDIPIFERVMN